MSIEIIKEIISAAELSNTLQLRNICLYVLCYAGFFRSEEVLSIRRSHMTFHDDYMVIEVKRVKLISLDKVTRLLSHKLVVVLVQFPFFEIIYLG